MTEFLDTFDYNLETGENYGQSLMAILTFADQMGMELQHKTFDEFSNAMRNKDEFVLR